VLELFLIKVLISGMIIINSGGNIHNTDFAFHNSLVIPFIKLFQIIINTIKI